ncbi:MAG: hypothetical protein LBD88_04550 [Candidatus Peribacteria bacterium]|jgi:hypothetical protein|nr:hypothetical protein [Candidatus Peribacteria bacterium]
MIRPKLKNNLAKNYLFLAGTAFLVGTAFLAGVFLARVFLAGAFLTTIFLKDYKYKYALNTEPIFNT